MKRVIFLVFLCVFLLSSCSAKTNTPTPDASPIIIYVYPSIEPSPELTPEPTPEPRIATEMEQLAIDGLLAMKKILLNPNSLQLNRCVLRESTIGPDILIDISVSNRAGGMDRTYYTIRRPKDYDTNNVGVLDLHYNVYLFNVDHIVYLLNFDDEDDEPLDIEWIMSNVK